ncbi:MAG TPA: hypothetical protein VI980_07570 [Acidimicrobiia bacterium]|nr:hypothetical protein [Acidimicrobiia bacterium]
MSQTTNERYAELQQQWHGWGSPVGLGILIVCAGAGIALVVDAIAGSFR